LTELLAGTKKGLFMLEGEPESGFEVKARAFAGQPVDFATRDTRSGRLFATVTSPFFGPKIFFTDSNPDEDWEQADGVAYLCRVSSVKRAAGVLVVSGCASWSVVHRARGRPGLSRCST
jgi:hypothetical protein